LTGWKRPFDDPIPLPRGRQLITLEDAGNYIAKLPRAEYSTPEWQAAMECLILVAENDGPTMLARIGVMRALNRHPERVFNPDHGNGQNWQISPCFQIHSGLNRAKLQLQVYRCVRLSNVFYLRLDPYRIVRCDQFLSSALCRLRRKGMAV
jgi:hypothetical protein